VALAIEGETDGCVLRNRRPGDRLAGRTRSLHKALVDAKIPRSLRDFVPLIARGADVLWADGLPAARAWAGRILVRMREGPYAAWLGAPGAREQAAGGPGCRAGGTVLGNAGVTGIPGATAGAARDVPSGTVKR